MKQILYYLSFSLFIASCNLINPDEQEPAYLQVAGYSVETSSGQGTSSEKITEMWIYSNDNILSINPVGAQVPFLDKGPTKVTVRAGIKNNGASDMRIYYPFYQPYDTTIDFKSFEYHQIKPRFKYFPNAIIDATRNFETGSNFLAVQGLNQGFFDIINDPAIVFEGNKCAKVYLTGDNSMIFFKDETEVDIGSGRPIFLEMNYSCNQPFVVGVVSTVGSTVFSNDMVNVNGTSDGSGVVWNKIYIDLGPVGMLYPNAVAHNLYITCKRGMGADPPVIYLDNLKTVTWP